MTWAAFIRLLVSLFGLSGRELPPVREGVSRRAFLKTLGLTAAAIATLPEALALDEPLCLDDTLPSGIDLAEIDSLLKDLYLPVIVAELNAPSPLLKMLGDVTPVRSGDHYYVGYRRR